MSLAGCAAPNDPNWSRRARPDRVRLPGLDPAVRYRVTPVPELSDPGHPITAPPWLAAGVELPGSVLERVGVAVPVLHPQTGLLLSVSTARDATVG